MKFKLVLSAMVVLFLSVDNSLAQAAADCLQAATKQDIVSVNSSDVVRMISYSMLDHFKSDRNNTDAGVSVPIDGVPVGLTYGEAQAYAERVLQQSGISIFDDRKRAVMQSAISAMAPQLLSACLGAERIKVSYPASAFTSDTFDIQMQWVPDHHIIVPRPLFVHVTNGTYKVPLTQRFLVDHGSATISVTKTGARGDVTAVSISIGGDSIPAIEVPIAKPLRTFHLVTLHGVAVSQSQRKESWWTCTNVADMTTDDGKNSSHPDAESCQLCVDPTNEQVLLMNTIDTPYSTNMNGYQPQVSKSLSQVCVMHTVPTATHKETNYVHNATLTVRALSPD